MRAEPFQIQNFINGEFVEPISGRYLDNVEPATGKPYSQVADSDAHDVDLAVAAAEKAFSDWSKKTAAERSDFLLRIAGLVERDLEKFARAESIDTGKPIALARSLDIPRAVANFRFFATAILHTESEAHITDNIAFNYTLRQPRGIAGLISPWNLPLYLLSWKIAPAIAVGNTAIAKPSELTPMTAYMLCEVAREVGLPNGVLNVVHGTGPNVGSAITAHPKINTISFTGGTATGRKVAEACAPLFKKVSLELGGKNPNIIFADADLDAAIAGSVRSSFANQGQVCLCGSRLFVERSAYKNFVERFIDKASQLCLGDPLDEKTEQGAIVNKTQLEKVKFYVDLAQKEGGKIALGGSAPQAPNERCREGYFFQPTVITGLSVSCRTNREEIFGPVITITPFDSEEEVIDHANDVEYGLSSSVWTQNLSRAHRVAERINTGTVWVNCWLVRDLRVPFGGMKQSGVGREGGEEALALLHRAKKCLHREVRYLSYENRAEVEDLIARLRGYLWHTSSLEGFRQIHAQNAIKVNRGDLPKAYSQSQYSNCLEEGGISLFDLITHRDRDLIGEDLLLLDKWPGVMFRHTPTVFLGMELSSIASNLLFYPELKRRRGLGGIIPRIEVCHVGDISLDLVKKIGLWVEAKPTDILFYRDVDDAIGALAPKETQ